MAPLDSVSLAGTLTREVATTNAAVKSHMSELSTYAEKGDYAARLSRASAAVRLTLPRLADP